VKGVSPVGSKGPSGIPLVLTLSRSLPRASTFSHNFSHSAPPPLFLLSFRPHTLAFVTLLSLPFPLLRYCRLRFRAKHPLSFLGCWRRDFPLFVIIRPSLISASCVSQAPHRGSSWLLWYFPSWTLAFDCLTPFGPSDFVSGRDWIVKRCDSGLLRSFTLRWCERLDHYVPPPLRSTCMEGRGRPPFL